jgi:hypothetical protein
MGVVYEAFDNDRRATVALKTLKGIDGDALARFKREFRALQGLVHPNLVALDELLFENNQWFFTMELLDGVDFVRHVTGSPGRVPFASTVRQSSGFPAAVDSSPNCAPAASSFDERKLRDGLRQLLEGLSALHAVDRVHRDIKPSNVVVTHQGRVVLLDFGLVTEASTEQRSTGNAVVGTPVYMAPEQAASREVGPAADLYAVGVMLYEVLTGTVPFDGPQLQVLMDKQKHEPPPPSSLVPTVPADLDSLCARLLRFDPARRPTVSEALLSLAAPRASGASLPRGSTEAPIFVGRASELAALHAAFEETRGGIATVLVCGESGIGKSYMVRRFTGQLLAAHPEAMVLEGRCYERETVPYKTLDAVVDALSRRLSHMSISDVAAPLPVRFATLAQVFPALLRVPQVAREHAAQPVAAEPHELRQRAFAALRELFTRVAVRRPTVIVIDDLQWADDDGLRALAEILRPPDAPPLLLVGTVRIAPGGDDAGLARVRSAIEGKPRVIDLAKLGHEEARQLAGAFLRRATGDDAAADPEAIASEADGHPLFVEELARHVALGGSARDDVKLDDAIWSRVLQLETKGREIAELVALAGKPIPQEVAAAAARVEPGEFNRRVATLRVTNLVRTGGARWSDAIEPYHDRVREAVLAKLAPERRRALHEALALAFEASPHRDPETLATHWREAENASHATRYAVAAGDQASATFAFDRAARWYEQALGLLPAGHASRRELRIKLGDALTFVGRGAPAAEEFEAAAVGAPPLEALELRRRAAENLLKAGHFDRGIEASRAVLAAIGMRMPSTRFGVIASLVFYRLRLALRGLKFRAREKGEVTAQELIRIDTCATLSTALAFVDPAVCRIFATRALLLALHAGDLVRITCAVSVEAAASGLGGSRAWPRTERLLRYARELSDRSGDVRARWFDDGGAGVGLYASGHFRESAEALEHATGLQESGSIGQGWERLAIRNYTINSYGYLGRFKELRRLQQEGLRDGIARGDLFLTVLMRTGHASWSWLIHDQPREAETHAESAVSEWSRRGFHLVHNDALTARTCAKLYAGEVEAAHAVATELLTRTKRSLMWFIQSRRVRAFQLFSATSLAMLEGGRGDRAGLLQAVEKTATSLERERAAWADPFAKLARAGLALRRGDEREATATLDAAAAAFDATDMHGYAEASRDRAARLRGDAASAAEIARIADHFRAEDVAVPERFIRMLAPGLLAT